MMFGKHFYGFEKEGKSSYYSEKQMDQGFYFKLTFPLAQSLIKNESGGMLKVFQNSIQSTHDLIVQAQKVVEEDDGKENIQYENAYEKEE